jgi:hypothetical protein
MLNRLIRPLLTRVAQQRIERLELELREARSTIKVLELEQGKLLDVIERDRQRVQAERKRFVAAGERAVKAETTDDYASRQ